MSQHSEGNNERDIPLWDIVKNDSQVRKESCDKNNHQDFIFKISTFNVI